MHSALERTGTRDATQLVSLALVKGWIAIDESDFVRRPDEDDLIPKIRISPTWGQRRYRKRRKDFGVKRGKRKTVGANEARQ